MCEQFDIPAVGQEHDSHQPATKETQEEGERKICRLTTVSLNWHCEGKPVSEQSVWVRIVLLFLILFNSLYLYEIILLSATLLCI
jgi:hypothetical protein